jgi:hypothetical protein
MALKNSGGNSNSTLYILKIKTKDATGKVVDPFFQVSAKEDGKWVVTEDTFKSVSGKLTKVETRVGEYEGEQILSANIWLKDGDEAYLVDLKYTMLSRSIINSLLNLEDFDQEIEISLYTNKKGYASASVRAGGQLVDWKFGLDELPKPEKVKFKGKEMSDFTKVDSFFQEEIKSLGERVASSENGEGRGGGGSGADDGDRGVAAAKVAGDGEEEDEPLF